jgi:UDPglucose 6-dehydrogenase
VKITIFGSGYVGLVTGACLADVGNHVVCVDIDGAKVARLNAGEIPIFEPGLEEMVQRNHEAGRLEFTTDIAAGVGHGLFQFIAVGTPPDEDGSADLQHVVAVARSIGEHMTTYRIVVDKSTVPVGTADRVKAEIDRALAERGVEIEFDVVSNPEFLKEGAAVDDFMRPDRIIVGTDNPRTTELLRNLYDPFNRQRDRLIAMYIRSAELTKYAANAMLATKISFMNELANVAERVGADIEQVRLGIGSDPRIGYHFIYPGAGYGGSCFPKDVKALAHSARKAGFPAALLEAVETVNGRQKQVIFEKIVSHFGDDLTGKTVALWEAGVTVRAYDPAAMDETRRIYGERVDLVLCEDAETALEGADCLVVITEWMQFRSPDFDSIKTALAEPVVFDGRNLYEPELMKQLGFTYYGIGRGDSVQKP